MKVIDFIQEWVRTTDGTPIKEIVITKSQETDPQVSNPITAGISTNVKSCYGWSSDENCLYYKGIPACYKVYGLLVSNANLQQHLSPYFNKLDLYSYVFHDSDINSFISKLGLVLKRFYTCAVYAELFDDLLLDLVKKLNCKFEDPYLNYCSNLDSIHFREASKKHYERLQEKFRNVRHRELNGIWWEDAPVNVNITELTATAAGY